MKSYGSDLERTNAEHKSTLIPTKWSLGKGPTKGSGGGASARKGPLWEALSYPSNALKFRLGRDIIAGGELLQVVRNAPITRTRVVRMTRMRKRNQNNGEDTNSPGRTGREWVKKLTPIMTYDIMKNSFIHSRFMRGSAATRLWHMTSFAHRKLSTHRITQAVLHKIYDSTILAIWKPPHQNDRRNFWWVRNKVIGAIFDCFKISPIPYLIVRS